MYRVKLCAAALLTLIGTTAVGDQAIIDPAVIEGGDAVALWARLKGDPQGGVTYEWMRGTAYGLPDGAMGVVLFGIESVTIRQLTVRSPTNYVERTYACRSYRDATTGAYAREHTNPLTGRRITLTPRCAAGPTLRHSGDRIELMSPLPLTSTAIGSPMRLHRLVAGTAVFITRESHSEFRSPRTGASRRCAQSSLRRSSIASTQRSHPSNSTRSASATCARSAGIIRASQTLR
jgi:hypothetical protein